MRTALISFALLAATVVPTFVSAQEGEGRRLAELAFVSMDGAERGFVDHGQFASFGNDVFVSMDSNEDQKLSLAEFRSWDYGMELVADEAGRADAFDTAMRVVFAFWDRNGDGQISPTEHRIAILEDFRRADVDNDALLTMDEFVSGFSVMVAARAAINPPPAE